MWQASFPASTLTSLRLALGRHREQDLVLRNLVLRTAEEWRWRLPGRPLRGANASAKGNGGERLVVRKTDRRRIAEPNPRAWENFLLSPVVPFPASRLQWVFRSTFAVPRGSSQMSEKCSMLGTIEGVCTIPQESWGIAGAETSLLTCLESVKYMNSAGSSCAAELFGCIIPQQSWGIMQCLVLTRKPLDDCSK